MTTLQIDVARQAFSEISSRFPHLQCREDVNPNVDFSVIFPEQEGLKHSVTLQLQNNDELHLSVTGFQLEWFPCSQKDVAQDFIETAVNFIAGKYRIMEYWRGERCIKAHLQKPTDAGWKTIGTYGHISGLIPWPRPRTLIIQN